jgi:hypothetical protein
LLIISVFALAACEEGAAASQTPGAASPVPSPTSTPRSEWPSANFQAQYEGCRDHGFGGLAGKDGVLYYYFIDLPPEPHTPEVARATIAEHICLAGNHTWAPPGELGLLQGQFTVTELDEWNKRLSGPEFVGEIRWWSKSSSGDSTNRIVIDLMDLADEPAIRAHMAKAGIPQDAVVFTQGSPLIRDTARLATE